MQTHSRAYRGHRDFIARRVIGNRGTAHASCISFHYVGLNTKGKEIIIPDSIAEQVMEKSKQTGEPHALRRKYLHVTKGWRTIAT